MSTVMSISLHFKSLRTIGALFVSIFFIFPIMQHLRMYIGLYILKMHISFLLQFVIGPNEILAKMTGLIGT